MSMVWRVVVALVVIALAVLPFVGGGRTPPLEPEGFSAAAAETAPMAGDYDMVGVYTMSRGYSGSGKGRTIHRRWHIEAECGSGACSYLLTREQETLPSQTAPLVKREDGWYATFPPQVLTCGGTPEAPILWQQNATVVLRFDGGAITGHERKTSQHVDCGWGTATVDWASRSADV